MTTMNKPQLLHTRVKEDYKPITREGIPLEKGVVLTKEYLVAHEKLFRQYADFFTAYPDLYLDIIKPSDSNFELFFY